MSPWSLPRPSPSETAVGSRPRVPCSSRMTVNPCSHASPLGPAAERRRMTRLSASRFMRSLRVTPSRSATGREWWRATRAASRERGRWRFWVWLERGGGNHVDAVERLDEERPGEGGARNGGAPAGCFGGGAARRQGGNGQAGTATGATAGTADGPGTLNIRSRATSASRRVSGSTVIRLTTRPSARCSSAQST